MTKEDKKLNWQQACELLGCSRRTFYRLINTGQLCAWQVQGRKRGLWVWEKDVLDLARRFKLQI